jgi:glycolate oxidase FAD binding subunit
MSTLAAIEPGTFAQAAEALAAAGAEGRAVRIAGAGTKPWTAREPLAAAVPVRTTGLDRILAHDPGDMTATLQAGVALATAQTRFARAGQMLALDPPTGVGGDPDHEGAATIGGIVATADSGPLAHRYGGPRDLVVGATVALGDGTIARSGGTVIKNVAGYDIAKLLCGSFGTLGLILSVNVRLHPRRETITVRGAGGDPARLAAAAAVLAGLPAELEALDVGWTLDGGWLLARCAGAQAPARAERVATQLRRAGLAPVTVETEDERLWARQRAGQRSSDAAVVRIAARPSALAAVLTAATAVGGTLVGRAALGESYVTLAPERITTLRERLPAGAVSVLRDCPPHARAGVSDPWGTASGPVLGLARALKQRFDPAATCNPGIYVGGI